MLFDEKKNWFKELWKALLNPNNIATSIILTLILLLIFSVFKILFLNKVDFWVYSEFGDEKFIGNQNQTILYFTLVNTGTIPLEIYNIDFAWYDYSDKEINQNRWHNDYIEFFDENNQLLTQTIILPMEKMKIHTTIIHPENLSQGLQIIQVCPNFKPIDKVMPWNYRIGGICNKFYRLLWK